MKKFVKYAICKHVLLNDVATEQQRSWETSLYFNLSFDDGICWLLFKRKSSML